LTDSDDDRGTGVKFLVHLPHVLPDTRTG